MEIRGQFRAVVRGRVQGVGFRAHTRRAAIDEGVDGYTRNVEDGTVLVVAAGPSAALDRFVAWLHRGPTGARVDRVELDWDDTTPLPEGFEIRD